MADTPADNNSAIFPNDGPETFTGDVVVDDRGDAIDRWEHDSYVVQTRDDIAPAIAGDTLRMTLSYGGGCEDHDFTLVASDAFMESYPVQLRVALTHDAHGDRCRAYLTETYDFDLTPIKTRYQEAYQEDAGTIVLIVDTPSEDGFVLVYEFPEAGEAAFPDDWPRKSFTGGVVIRDTGVVFDRWGRDPYIIETRDDLAPAIAGDTLRITVSYSGGCADHDFTLVASDTFMESYPVQLRLALAHDAHGDLCKAYPTETYRFDLAPIKTLYQEAYQEDAGTIILNVDTFFEDGFDLVYIFPE